MGRPGGHRTAHLQRRLGRAGERADRLGVVGPNGPLASPSPWADHDPRHTPPTGGVTKKPSNGSLLRPSGAYRHHSHVERTTRAGLVVSAVIAAYCPSRESCRCRAEQRSAHWTMRGLRATPSLTCSAARSVPCAAGLCEPREQMGSRIVPVRGARPSTRRRCGCASWRSTAKPSHCPAAEDGHCDGPSAVCRRTRAPSVGFSQII